MKLLQYKLDVHKKSVESMKRMCKVFNIEYESTDSEEILHQYNYDILWLPYSWIHPSKFPTHLKLLYGPHGIVFPENHPICDPRDDKESKRAVYTCLSPWVKNMFSEFTTQSIIPFEPLPFGVELKQQRNLNSLPFRILFYSKYRHPFEVEFILEVLKQRNIPIFYFTYGSYLESEYQKAIDKSHFCVWLGCSETQGFAFQECLGKNVPILCLSVKSMIEQTDMSNGKIFYESYNGKKKLEATTASWWSNECGIKITDLAEFEDALDQMIKNYQNFTPREFIKRELSDEVCMKRILDYYK